MGRMLLYWNTFFFIWLVLLLFYYLHSFIEFSYLLHFLPGRLLKSYSICITLRRISVHKYDELVLSSLASVSRNGAHGKNLSSQPTLSLPLGQQHTLNNIIECTTSYNHSKILHGLKNEYKRAGKSPITSLPVETSLLDSTTGRSPSVQLTSLFSSSLNRASITV